jgi:hypothetical protein
MPTAINTTPTIRAKWVINTTPTIRAKELVIGNTMDLIRELEHDLGPTNSQFDGKVIKQLKKLVNRMARDIGAERVENGERVPIQYIL